MKKGLIPEESYGQINLWREQKGENKTNTTTQIHHPIKQTSELFTWKQEGYLKSLGSKADSMGVPLPDGVDSFTLALLHITKFVLAQLAVALLINHTQHRNKK